MKHLAPTLAKLLDTPEAVFAKYWNGKTLYPEQKALIDAVLSGQDGFGVLYTGRGKSAVFQVAAHCLPGATIVVSPLIALMSDQVRQAKERGISAECLTSFHSEEDIAATTQAFSNGKFKLLYVAPERLDSRAFLAKLSRVDIDLVVADEMHCLSRWGTAFRPAYAKIGQFIERIERMQGRCPIRLGLTATMTPAMEKDVYQRLGFTNPFRLVGDPIRPNLTYRGHTDREWRYLSEYGARFSKGGRHLVYTATRKAAETITRVLCEDGLVAPNKVGFYHAGMEPVDRVKVQKEFASGTLDVIVATCAFGMGIDIPDIRTVLHFGYPGSMEDAVQEGGRAGRDGLPAVWAILGSETSINIRQMFIESENPPWWAYEVVWDWLQTNCDENETLYLTVEDFVRSIDPDRLKSGLVGGVLSRLDSMGAIDRRPMGGNIKITVLPVVPAPGAVNASAQRLLHFLYVQARPETEAGVKDAPIAPPLIPTDVIVSKREMAAAAGVTEAATYAIINRLSAAKVIHKVPVFTGKSTAWAPGMRSKELAEVVSREAVEERLRVAQQKLQHVVSYASAPDRVAYIRNYFSKATP